MENLSIPNKHKVTSLQKLILMSSMVGLLSTFNHQAKAQQSYNESQQMAKISMKTPSTPLAFAKENIVKYFPEREGYYNKLVASIEANPKLLQRTNTILNQTIMQPRTVHQETTPRPSTDKDRAGATLLFLEWIVQQTTFYDAMNKKDGTDKLFSDNVSYTKRLELSDKTQIARDMLKPVSDAADMFYALQNRQ